MNAKRPGTHASIVAAVLSLATLGSTVGLGQTSRTLSGAIPESDLTPQSLRASMQMVQPAGVAMESTIDAAQYRVGPSDQIAVNIWVTPPVSFTLTVTPEGSLIVPTVGEVQVVGMTLADAKKRVIEATRRTYGKGEVTVTLVRPRPILVMVTGAVLFPGMFTLSAIDRAGKAIEEANTPPRPEMVNEYRDLMSQMSTRNVVLQRRDGSVVRVDIAMFLATKEDRWNPLLREGDVIVVPRRDETRNVVAVYGEVNVPGRYEFVQGDSLRQLVRIAHGLTRYANTDSALFSRLDAGGMTMKEQIFDLGPVLRGVAPDIELQPGDRLVIPSLPDKREDYRVNISGEVRHPGIYPITRNSTRLTHIIERAGGFTDQALLSSARVLRRGTAADTIFAARGRTVNQDLEYLRAESAVRTWRDHVSVDFVRLFVARDSLQDIILKPDDEIVIPTKRNTIYVYGQVAKPGHIPFVPGEDIDYYLAMAGGTLSEAKPSEIRIIKGATRQWVEPEETKIEDGDEIWVPRSPQREFGYFLGIIAQSAAIVSVAISLILISK